LDVFFYCIWQQEHRWIPSLDTPSLEIGELQATRNTHMAQLGSSIKSVPSKLNALTWPLLAALAVCNGRRPCFNHSIVRLT